MYRLLCTGVVMLWVLAGASAARAQHHGPCQDCAPWGHEQDDLLEEIAPKLPHCESVFPATVPCEDKCGAHHRPHRWEARASFIYAERDEADDSMIVLPSNNTLSGSDFDFEAESGFDLSLIRWCTCYWGLEGRLVKFQPWESSEAMAGTAATLNTELVSGEVNVFNRPAGWLRFFAGFRWVRLEDELSILDAATSALEAETRQDMYGFQLGTDINVFCLPCCSCCCKTSVRLDGFLRAGVFYNDVVANATLTDVATGTLQDADATSDEDMAFVGEVGVTLGVCVTRNLWVNIGYRALWLEGLALSTDQADLIGQLGAAATGDLEFDGGMMVQGGSVSAVLNW